MRFVLVYIKDDLSDTMIFCSTPVYNTSDFLNSLLSVKVTFRENSKFCVCRISHMDVYHCMFYGYLQITWGGSKNSPRLKHTTSCFTRQKLWDGQCLWLSFYPGKDNFLSLPNLFTMQMSLTLFYRIKGLSLPCS